MSSLSCSADPRPTARAAPRMARLVVALIAVASVLGAPRFVRAEGKSALDLGLNVSVTLGSTWGDSEYVTPLSGAFAFGVRAEAHLARQDGGWALGLYGEAGDPGSHFEARWLGGGGLMLLSPRLLVFGAAWSIGVYGRESTIGAYSGLTSGLTVGLRPRAFVWDFLIAARVDVRSANSRAEKTITVGVQLDVGVLIYLVAGGLKVAGWR